MMVDGCILVWMILWMMVSDDVGDAVCDNLYDVMWFNSVWCSDWWMSILQKKKLELCKDFERSSCAKNFGDNCDNQSSNQGLGVWSPETLHWRQTSYFKRRAQKHQTCQRSLWISTGYAALGINFHAFLGKPLSFKDVQNALCEYENYNRTALSIQIEEMGDEDNRKIEMLLSGVSMTKLESLRGEWCVLCVGDIVIRIIKTSSLITSRFIRTVVRLRKPGGKMMLIMKRLSRMTSVSAQNSTVKLLKRISVSKERGSLQVVMEEKHLKGDQLEKCPATVRQMMRKTMTIISLSCIMTWMLNILKHETPVQIMMRGLWLSEMGEF